MRRKERSQRVGRASFKVSVDPTRQGKAVAADISDRILVNKFGVVHNRAILQRWPDRLRVLMGVEFIDPSELTTAGNVHAR